MSIRLNGICLITGAASGIGRGTAIELGNDICKNLFLADIDAPGLAETKRQVQAASPATRVETYIVDIADESSVQQMVDACVDLYGRMDYAVNIAGVVPHRMGIAEVAVATYDKVIEINEYGTWLCHQAEIRQMVKQEPLDGYGTQRGSIVSVSSLAGLNASSGMSVYCASKHSMIGFAKVDAQDYGPQGVRINVICPGMIDTELFRLTSPQDAPPKLAAITPVRRLGEPKDIAWLAAFLCSQLSGFIQGAVIPCDGGLVLQRGVI